MEKALDCTEDVGIALGYRSCIRRVLLRLPFLDSAWRTNTSVTRRLGDLRFRTSPLVPLKVPSVVVDTEWNLLFHPDWGRSHAVVVDKAALSFDVRMWS